MKKKFLLLLSIVFCVVCLFAISVNAEVVISESNLDENGDIVADLLVDLGDNYHIVSVDISYTDINGETKEGKFYYETSFWAGRNMRQIKTTYVPKDLDLSQIVYFCDKVDINGNGTYEGNEYIKLYQGGDAYKTYAYASYENGEFSDTVDIKNSLQAISYSRYFEKFPDNGFGSKAAMLKTITYNGREAVEGTLIVSPKIDEIFSGSFGGDGPSTSENSIVPAFTRVVFEDREGSVSFGQYCFTRVAFEEIVFGKGTYYLGNGEKIALIFSSKYPDDATLKRVIVDKETVIGSGSISWNVGTYEVIFIGTEAEMEASYQANCKDAFSCASTVYADPCYFGHTEAEDDGDCTSAVVCPVCNTYIFKEAKAHVNGKGVYYDSLFTSVYYFEGCTNEGCLVKETSDLGALLVWKGYSACTYTDNLSVTQGFVVNTVALEKLYENIDGFDFGVIAAVNKTDAEIAPMLDDSGVISKSFNSIAYDYVDVKVTGIPKGQEDTPIVFCLYAVVDGELFYLDNNKMTTSIRGISYNGLIKNNG